MDLRFRSLAAAFLALLLVAAAGRAAEPSDGKGGGLFAVRRACKRSTPRLRPSSRRPSTATARLYITATIQAGLVYLLNHAEARRAKTYGHLAQPVERFPRSRPIRRPPEAREEGRAAVRQPVIESHKGTVTWYAPLELATGVDPAKLKIAGKVAMRAAIPGAVSTKIMPGRRLLGKGVDVSPPAVEAGKPAARCGPRKTSSEIFFFFFFFFLMT